MIHLFTNRQGTSVLVGHPGQEILVNGSVDISVSEFADIDVLTKGQQLVTFAYNTLISVTGLSDNRKECSTLNFARESRGTDVGHIFCGSDNLRFWPRLRKAVLVSDVFESVFAQGGLDFVITYGDEFLLPNYRQGDLGQSGWIIMKEHIARIFANIQTDEEKLSKERLERLLPKFKAADRNTELKRLELVKLPVRIYSEAMKKSLGLPIASEPWNSGQFPRNFVPVYDGGELKVSILEKVPSTFEAVLNNCSSEYHM